VSHPIDPAKLLEQAEALAGVDAGPGRPSTTDHRRAVSAAYYALFHAISLAAARYILPDGAPDEEIWQTTRWIDHRDVRAVCEAVAACAASRTATVGLPKGLSQRAEPLWDALSEPGEKGGRVAKVPVSLWAVAIVFVALHAARQSADYDHSAEFSKDTTIGHVQEASVAMDYLRENAANPDFQRFFAWVFARASGFKS
jgi:hypothetical protein